MKSIRKMMGSNFVAGGWGRNGPYLVATHRIANRTYVKASTGMRGTTVGLKQVTGGRNYELGYNFTSKNAYLRHSTDGKRKTLYRLRRW